MQLQDVSRRSVLMSGVLAGATALTEMLPVFAQSTPRGTAPRLARVIIDNDFSGDPDGLFQLAHHVLCPSLDFPIIIGSHLPAGFSGPGTATEAAAKAQTVLNILNLSAVPKAIAGAELPIKSRAAAKPVPATAAIIHEAMRDDIQSPLIYAAGAGLTDLALAWIAEPRIGRRLRLLWIGGGEHPGMVGRLPEPNETEFNYSVDPLAAQIVFNDSDIEIWQVPRDVYRQMLFTKAELDELAASGPLGRYLKGEIDGLIAKLATIPNIPLLPQTEAYVLGDSPLVTLTALVEPFRREATSSQYAVVPTPLFNEDGSYQSAPKGRPMRVYQSVDANLTFRDMTSRFRNWQREHRES